MKERNILAGFHTEENANKAANALKKAGFETIQVEQLGKFPGEGPQVITNPISGEIPTLGHLTLGAAFFQAGRDASVMAAADPAASGMSDGGPDTIGPSFLLTAVVPENRGDEAVQLIRSFGGDV